MRTVDTASLRYAVARRFMTRLTHQDLADPAALASLAQCVGLEPAAFVQRFAPIVADDPAQWNMLVRR